MSADTRPVAAEPGPAGEAYPPTGRSLPIALLRAREKVMAPIREMLAGAGVTEQQWRVLRVLDERGPLAPSAICAEACLQAPSLSRIIQGLVEKGLAARLTDAGDRRRQRVSLLPAGRAVIVANRATSRRLAQDIQARLGKERHDQLLDLLQALNALDP
ncbi:MarR family transcriptional regulator [Rubrimonas cliftonensis]|uniref:Transcriptional regulator, MarR family n=1 Tax=Rubrimonas cliftonensis TaxID=89524 RepID=A0A1H4FMW5_9RHOB|nr:MarR family transcriptional regulator [Rubrimonas cliftonensis]SEA97842.1 transcriptional regulator, MarR family [Rubrimonas cliftonensis]